VNASMAKSANSATESTSCATCNVIQSTRRNCAALSTALAFVHMELGTKGIPQRVSSICLLLSREAKNYFHSSILETFSSSCFHRCHFIHSSQEALTHNKNVAAYQARLQQQQQQQQQSRMKTMSLSTASDRETSSVGSLSPTMTHIQNQSSNACYGDQTSPTNSIFTYSFSPSHSPILNEMSASVSPPPIISSGGMFVKPKFIDQTTVAAAAAAMHANVMQQIPEDARLPIFNQISSTIDVMGTLAI
jgi:hypothetical protein